jgi:hypothetical protein
MSRSSVLPYKRQGPEKSLSLDLPARPISCRYGRYLSHLVDSDDAVVGGRRFDEANRFAVVVLGDHGFNLRVEILLG